MRRTEAILVVTGLAFFLAMPAPAAGAKGYKPPKSSCWQLDGTGSPLDGFFLAIALKPSGVKLKDMNGSVKFYSIQGAMASSSGSYYNFDGSGYVDAADNQFEGNIDGKPAGTGFVTCNIYLNEVSPNATCAVAPDLLATSSYELLQIDCEMLTLN